MDKYPWNEAMILLKHIIEHQPNALPTGAQDATGKMTAEFLSNLHASLVTLYESGPLKDRGR